MNYIVFDLEATCWDQYDKSPNETIEIGAVLVNDQKEIVSEFMTFVKPIKYPKLSDFCTELTSIQQSDVENAPYFNAAIEDFKKWCAFGDQEYVLCSWGFYDKKQFESDSEVHGLSSDWVNNHISIKHQYGKFKKLKRAVGMQKALKLEGFKLDGTHHRGIDDARNIAKIFIKYFDEWKF
ncbi:MAG: 3'-5' exoribonuclease 1 [Crocinitomix sp.]|jgi:3'-5' exoribonuclease 1